LEDFTLLQPGFAGFANCCAHQLSCSLRFGLAAPVITVVGNECSKALPSKNDPLPFEFLVGALDGDHAYHEFLRKFAEGRQGFTTSQTSFADLPPQPVNNLLIKRPGGGRRNGGRQPGGDFIRHTSTVYNVYIQSRPFCSNSRSLPSWRLARSRSARLWYRTLVTRARACPP
jgi:hypothetical protein